MLSGTEQKVYYAVFEGLACLSPEIRVPRIAYSRLSEIYTMVKYDYPEFFFAGSPSFRINSSGEHVTLIPAYYFGHSETEAMCAAVEKRLFRILSPALTLTENDRVIYVRRWLLSNVTYEKLTRRYSHESYGVLFHGIGVCEGIAKTAKLMLDRLNIDSLVVLGSENEEGIRHAWNILYLYGKPRHYDFTYMLTLPKGIKRNPYESATDQEIFRDHRPPVFAVPSCL